MKKIVYESKPLPENALRALGLEKDKTAKKGTSAENFWFHPALDIFFTTPPSAKEFIDSIQEHARNEIRQKTMKALHSI